MDADATKIVIILRVGPGFGVVIGRPFSPEEEKSVFPPPLSAVNLFVKFSIILIRVVVMMGFRNGLLELEMLCVYGSCWVLPFVLSCFF